jgi:8-oxo-dGTP pyrophosphatase MutT (NUDIX family)
VSDAASGEQSPSAGPHAYRVLNHREVFQGAIFTLASDDVAMPGGGSSRRDYLRHPGSVAIAALDASDRIVLVRQYRHAVGTHLWELPAGLLDIHGEAPVRTAARELAEEVDLVAARWDLLIQAHASPGYSDEFSHVFLARELTPVPVGERTVRTQEEAELVPHWVDLDEAVAMVLRAEITVAVDVAGILAVARARDAGWTTLRSAADAVRP